MSFGMPYTAVHLNITIANLYFRKQNSFWCTHQFGCTLCMWCTTKVNVGIELWSGLIQDKCLVFMKVFHGYILLHFKENVCQ